MSWKQHCLLWDNWTIRYVLVIQYSLGCFYPSILRLRNIWNVTVVTPWRSHELKPCFSCLFCAGTPPSTEQPAGPYPFMVDSDDGRKVPVVQAYAYGKYLGYLNVTFDKNGNVVEAVGNPILLDSSIPEGMWTRNLILPAALCCNSSLVKYNVWIRTWLSFWACCSFLCRVQPVLQLNMHAFRVHFYLFKIPESPFVINQVTQYLTLCRTCFS